MKKLLLLLVVFVFAVSGAFAESTATATGHVDAEIIAPISVSETTHLNFGRWASPTSGPGTVVISPAAAPSPAPSGVTSVAGGTAASAGIFAVTNDGGVPYAPSVTPATVTITNPNSDTMSVGTFTYSCNSNCTNATLYVGATLSIAQNQAAGAYTGEYTLTLTY